MKMLTASFVMAGLLLAIMAHPCQAEGRKQKPERVKKKDSKALCYILSPWPHRCRECKDSDGDGVPDGSDKCPDTPCGATVNERGCPLDSDGDGVYDGIDRCPDTPKKTKVDTKGCPLDSDGDGVYDGIDRCPDTPKKTKVDTKGCPIDSDGDGVYDGIDRCPDTPTDLAVDKYGCPIEISEKETELLDTGMITASNITFETGKADLRPESRAVIDEIEGILEKWPELEIEIGGHTDSQGSDEYNQKLSEMRAKAVLDYIAANFTKIDLDGYTAKGYGEKEPIAPNDTAGGRAKNRRVVFKVLNKEELRRDTEHKRYKKR